MLRNEPEARERAAALFTDNSKKSVVLAANPAARARAIEPGMTAPQAVARCPDLLIRTPNPAAETEAAAALLAVGFTVSPSIEDTASGVCTIDLKGAAPAMRARGAHAAILQLEALGFCASAGIGATPLLALYAARAADAATTNAAAVAVVRDRGAKSPSVGEAAAEYGDSNRSPSRSLFSFSNETNNGKNRENENAPARVLTIADAKSFLAPLPLAAADPTPEIAGILASWGLRTFGELTALPRDDVGRRLGIDGLALWDRAGGGATRPLRPVPSPQAYAAAMEFEEEVETLEPLLFILRRFLERLTLELRTSGFVAAALELTLQLADDSRHQRSFRLPEPTADVDILFRALHTHLDSLRTAASISGVQLRAEPTRPLVRQQGLFDTGLRDPHGFAETLARIVAVVGSDRVGTPQLEDTHRPDAVKLVRPAPVVPPAGAPPVHRWTGLPLRRYRPPLRAQLELTNGRPTYLWTDRFNGSIAHVRGPWLSSGEWWQADRSWRRSEYDIALENGGLYRLVLTDRSWFIEGEYD